MSDLKIMKICQFFTVLFKSTFEKNSEFPKLFFNALGTLHKKLSFQFRISLVNVINLFTEEILNGKLHVLCGELFESV